MPISQQSAKLLGAKLKAARVAQGLTVKQLMEQSGAYLDPSYFSHVESGRQTPSLESLSLLASALALDLDDLLARAGTSRGDYRSQNFSQPRQPAEASHDTSPVSMMELVAAISVAASSDAELDPLPPPTFSGADAALAEADEAEARFQWENVVACLRAALELLPMDDRRRGRLLGRLALALAWTFSFRQAKQAALEAGHLISADEGDAAAADFLSLATHTLHTAGDKEGAWNLAQVAMPMIGDRRDVSWARVAVHYTEAAEAAASARYGMAVETPERRELSRAIVALPPAERAPLLQWAWPEFKSRSNVLRNFSDHAGVMLFHAGEYERARTMWEALLERYTAEGRLNLACRAAAHVGLCHCALGNIPRANSSARQAIALGSRPGWFTDATMDITLLLHHIKFATNSGWSEHATTIEPFLAQAESGGARWALAASRAAGAHIYARLGRAERACELIRDILPAIDRSPGGTAMYAMLVCFAAEACWVINDRAGPALDLISRNLEEKVLQPDFRFPMTDARRSLGLLAALQGERETASSWFQEARMVLDEQEALSLRAIVDYDEALMHCRMGDVAAAQHWLERAIPAFADLQMDGWSAAARALQSQAA